MWYSAFSLRSPSPRAARIRSAIARRPTVSSAWSSASSAFRPAGVIASRSGCDRLMGSPRDMLAQAPNEAAKRNPHAREADLVEQERDDLRGALHLGLDGDDRGAADDRVVVDEPLSYAHDRIRERADVGPRLERAALLLLAIKLGKLPDRAALHAAIA